MKHDILSDKYKNTILSLFGYVKLPAISEDAFQSLLDFYNKNIQFDSYFFNSILSEDIDVRKSHSDFIKQVLKPYIDSQLLPYKHIMSTFFSRNKAENQHIGPHQDPTTVNFLDYDDFIIWIPLVDTIYSKSGRLGVKPFSHHFSNRLNFSKFEYYPDYIVSKRQWLIHLNLKKGEPVILFNNLIHSSETNTVFDSRPAVSMKFTTQNAEIASFHMLDWEKKIVDVYIQQEDDYYVKYGWDESKPPLSGTYYKQIVIS
ncbi:MAG: hypothetical protein U0X41_12495 [Chitinophagales bacterium]